MMQWEKQVLVNMTSLSDDKDQDNETLLYFFFYMDICYIINIMYSNELLSRFLQHTFTQYKFVNIKKIYLPAKYLKPNQTSQVSSD